MVNWYGVDAKAFTHVFEVICNVLIRWSFSSYLNNSAFEEDFEFDE